MRDGFIAGPNEGADNGLGDGGERLHDWFMAGGAVDLEAIRRSGSVNGNVVDEFMSTGAVAVFQARESNYGVRRSTR